MTELQIEVLFDNPDRVWDVAYWHGEEEEEGEGEGEGDENDRIENIETLLGEPLCEELDIDKSWAILRFLLLKAAGQPFSYDRDDFSSELLWGESIGDEPADYVGPALRSIEETREFANFLRPLSKDQLLSHFNWQEMRKEGTYLIWDETPDPQEERDLREYAVENFLSLQEYVLKAAASRCGLLLWVS